jgi:sec-independent protein translocase protein TatB
MWTLAQYTKRTYKLCYLENEIGDEIEADKLKEHLNLEDKDANIIEIFDQTKESLNEIKRDGKVRLHQLQ